MNRWAIAVAAIFLQIALGAVYAWSVFRDPLAKAFHWTVPQITLTFTVAVFALGVAAFIGGLWTSKAGPRVVAMTGGFLYGLGVLLAAFTTQDRLWWLYLTYGVIGGTGLGFAYIVPIGVLVKWFPDKRGLMTGIAVGGFGVGALITAPVATRLLQSVGVHQTFIYLGSTYLVVSVLAASFMKNPPEGFRPAGWQPTAAAKKGGARDYTLGEALASWQWWALWLLLFINTSAGISLISQEAPLFRTLGGLTAAAAAGIVGVVAIGNAAGRVFWAWFSDLTSRKTAFAVIYLLQVALFWMLPNAHTAGSITLVAFLILLCYGGGFGTMPAFTADYFGAKNYSSIYGLMLTAWGFASAFGPILVAKMYASSGTYTPAMHLVAVILLVSLILPIMVRPPQEATAPRTSPLASEA
jgi:MFS transporter, OFA family, oxalate/formate antiporter